MAEEEDWAFGPGHFEFAMPLRHHAEVSVGWQVCESPHTDRSTSHRRGEVLRGKCVKSGRK